MRGPSQLVLLVALCASAVGCKKLSELTASPDASVPAHDRVFGDLRINVPEDVTEKEFSGALELTRRPLPQNRTNPDMLSIAPLSAFDYRLRSKSSGDRATLPHGEYSYRTDDINYGSGVGLTLDGSMKIEPDSYYRVTCHVYAVDGKRPPTDWCFAMLRTAAHR